MASLNDEDTDTAVMTEVKTELPDDDGGENRSAAAADATATEKTSDDEDDHMSQDHGETSDKVDLSGDWLADDVALNTIKQEKKTEVILDLSRVADGDDDDDDDDDDSADGLRYLSFPFSLSSTSSFIVVTDTNLLFLLYTDFSPAPVMQSRAVLIPCGALGPTRGRGPLLRRQRSRSPKVREMGREGPPLLPIRGSGKAS